MTQVVEFALLGLGIGAIYSLLAQGVVLIYRGAGIVNFAHGTAAMVGAYTFYELRSPAGTPAAVAAGILAAAVVGVLIQVLVMRPLAGASALTRLVANLGVLVIIQSAATIKYAGQNIQVAPILPEHLLRFHGIVITSDRLLLALIALVLTAALWLLSRRSLIGAATSAVQENPLGAATLGWSPNLIALLNWGLGCGLAGFAGILVVPITGLEVANLTLIVVAALAAALLGGFSSFWWTFAGGMGIGVLNSEASRYITAPGWPDAVPFVLIVVVLVVRGRGLPLRDQVLERLPRVGDGTVRPAWVVTAFVVASALILHALSADYVVAMSVLLTGAMFMLSVVVLTGYAGQLSLAQYALGGIAALVAGRLIAVEHWSQGLAILVGLAVTVPVGMLFAVPALRTRGVNLAVVTLGLGLAIDDVVFSNTGYTGGTSGTTVGPLHLLGLDLDPFLHPKAFTMLTLVCFTAAALGVANLRRSRVGRRLLAVRSNERAAASLGISVVGAKLYAFAVAAALAGVGGILLAFSNYAVIYTSYDPLSSVNIVALAVIGGVGFLIGPLAGSVLTAGALGTVVGQSIFGQGFANWLTLIGGVALVVSLILQPDGVVATGADRIRSVRRRIRAGTAPPVPAVTGGQPAPARVRASSLSVTDIRVTFGAVVAVDGVSLHVEPGEIVGVIGPNGAGKTTLIDAVSGMVTSEGSVLLDGVELSGWPAFRRVRAGLSRSFQSLELFEDLTVRENIRTAFERRDRWAYATSLLWPRPEPAPAAAAASIRFFELEADLDRRPGELSAGRRRLVAIARAVAAEPSILLLDEPAAGLDETESIELARLLRTLADDWGIGILLVEHDMHLVMSTCDRVDVLEFGRPLASGTPDEVRHDQRVVAAYLGGDTGASDPHPAAAPPAVVLKVEPGR